MERAQHGDEAAFAALYREHAGRIYALSLRMLASSVRAEELTQDVFVQAWQMLGSFRGESAFSSWLHRLAVNVILTEMRTDKRRAARITVAEDVERFDTDSGEALSGTALDLEAAIALLPPQARAVFVLHDVEGFAHEEIAALMHVAVGTSKAQLSRARELLRTRLRTQGYNR